MFLLKMFEIWLLPLQSNHIILSSYRKGRHGNTSNALKHLSYDEVISAWQSITKSIQRASGDEPPRWLCIGWLPSGASVEIIAVETISGWLVIHATSPVQQKFANEIAETERRMR